MKGVLGTVALPAVGHAVIVPMVLRAIVAGVPVMGWIAPNALPGPVPPVGIVPGTAVGDVIDGDGVRIGGVLRPVLTCAKAELLPTKINAAVKRAKLRIGASCILTHSNRYRWQIAIVGTFARLRPAAAPCRRQRA